jgi:hypothetical protein
MKKRLASMIGMAAALGMSTGAIHSEPSIRSRSTEKNEFQKFHDSLRQLRRRVWVRHSGSKPYVKPAVPGIVEIKGKLNLKRAKRERVRAMKAAQGRA